MDIKNDRNQHAGAGQAVRLKHLGLQGYKTFAARTEFVFDGGITAIVGPNGSGKSNIADAIRWVLGEQSYRSLRGKRTEDMIFSGSAQRARLGMASVSLVLDNADGWLPIDFAEVTVTRRAYRSGENEYLLNGSRVRLRDISELLAQSGLARRTYTVVGQGLVDAVLSLRADDRRALFEEAAGISLFQSKRLEALSRLDETRSNLLRANDIINEIAPRLRRLERDAERAERHALLSQQLERLLRTWYGCRWREEQLNLRRSRDALARRETSLDRRRQELEALDEQVAAFRARRAQLREQLAVWHGESSELHAQMEGVQRDLAVWQERARLLAGQCDEMQAELVGLEAQGQAAARRVAAAEQKVAEGELDLKEQLALVDQAQARLDAHEDQRAALAQRLADAQARVLDLAAQSADRRNRLEQLAERRTVLAPERAEHQAALAGQQSDAAQVRHQQESVTMQRSRLQAEAEALDAQTAHLNARLSEAQAHQTELLRRLADVQRTVERLQGRYELLTRLRAEGEGLRAGVRAVLQAAVSGRRSARSGQQPAISHQQSAGDTQSQSTNPPIPQSTILSGIIGTVAQLLRVPAEYETAIEAALGGHLQDVVVESWADAEAGIAFLRAGKRGRATFLPVDTVQAMARVDVPGDEGLVAVAPDLVRAEKRLALVVELLLGRTLVARDLSAARRILRPGPSGTGLPGHSSGQAEQALDRLQGAFQVVTLAGEVLRSSGSVTGGRSREQVQGRVLAREREWRILPSQIEEAGEQVRTIETALGASRAAEAGVRDEAATLETRRRKGGAALAAVEAQRFDLVRDAERIAQQVEWRQELVAKLDGEAMELDAQEATLRVDLGRLTAEGETAAGRAAAIEVDLEELRGEALYQRLSEARTAAAVARGTWEHRRAESGSLQEGQVQLQAQIEAKRTRIAELEGEQASLAEQIRAQASREMVIRGWLEALAARIDPAEAQVQRLEGEREALEGEETSLRARLREAESRRAQALLAQSRQGDRLQRLRRQIMDDFGLVEMEPMEGIPDQPPLPLGEMVSTLPVVEKLPEGLEEEIRGLRIQLQRMGSINPNAPDEYAEVMDRHGFLTSQVADLEEAASSLGDVIAELEEVMRAEFQTTFNAVATRFGENFTQLFGGGTARLVLTEPGDVSRTGVDIVAQPPGRRQQTLALLSGGERSLTAVAFIFALLEVSAPPFCILDEVDAMLDEANVQRFRQALEALAEQTQFIVITHNRRTIETADTIYGVSMGDDSVSQVVSLRLDGDRVVSPEGSALEALKS